MSSHMGMLILFAVLAVIMCAKAEIHQDADQLFSRNSTCAMRGFWSIIVILVHVPAAFGNPLQDMAGGFAYIGVTFFFMTSAYGLKTVSSKKGMEGFWQRRLPKLLIPMACANVVMMLMRGNLSFSGLLHLNGWVEWLLYCYFLFWLAYKLNLKYKDMVVCFCIVVFSLYRFAKTDGGWPTEIYGFIWGIFLANNMQKLTAKISLKHWLAQCAGIFAVALVLGLLYMKYKPIIFWGNYLLKICLGAALILLIVWVTRRIKIGNRVSLLLGKISYETYLLHGTVMTTLAHVKPDMESAVFLAVSIVCTLILSAAVHEVTSCIMKRVKLPC